MRKTPFKTFVGRSKWNILASSHVPKVFFYETVYCAGIVTARYFFYINTAVLECEEGPKVVLKWLIPVN